MRRPRQAPEEDNELRWLTTYGDVVTLLLAFFVMLYAISQVDARKFELFVTGLADPFGNVAASEGLLGNGAAIVGAAYVDLVPVSAQVDGIAILDGLPDLERDDIHSSPESPPDPAPLASDLAQVREDLTEALREAGLTDLVDIEADVRGLTLSIGTDNVLFASGSAEFGAEGRRIIGVIAPTLATFSNDLMVEGHTDTQPIHRRGYDNWNLSADRSLAVLRLLTDDYDIDARRISATGYGEFRPRASNETESGRAVNRRVELVIVAVDGGYR